MKFVIDACSIILLGKARLLETALNAYSIVSTQDAYREVIEGNKDMHPDAMLAERLHNDKKLELVKSEKKLMEKLENDFNMGKGEAATIAAAIRIKGAVITDNRQGRKAATVNGLPLIGSVEIIVNLYKKGKISAEEANNALKTLKEAGWFDEYLIEKAEEDVKNERS